MAYFRRYGYRRSYRYRPRRSYRSYNRSYSSYRPRTRKSTTKRRRSKTTSNEFETPELGRSGSKYVTAQTDPFDENVDGVKIPDANSQPSISAKAEDAISITTGATFTCTAAAFNPSAYKYTVAATAASANSWTWSASFTGATDSQKQTKFVSEFDLWRPVAHAIRITCGLAPTNVTGFLHVAVFTQPMLSASTWVYPTTLSDLANVPGYKRIPLARLTAEGITIVNRPLDCTAQRYLDMDSNEYSNANVHEFQVPFQWGSIVLAVEGVPVSTACLAVENVLHIEAIPRTSSVNAPNPAASYNPGALGAASQLMSKTSPTFTDSEKGIRKRNAMMNAARGLYKVTGRATANTGRGKKLRRVIEQRPKSRFQLPGISDRSLSTASDVKMSAFDVGTWV